MAQLLHSNEGPGASITSERALPRVSVQEFKLDQLLTGEVEAVYFRTESGNIYRINKVGALESAADRHRGWETIQINLQREHENTIAIGHGFDYDAPPKERTQTVIGCHTTPVTEIVYLAITGLTRPSELIRPSELQNK